MINSVRIGESKKLIRELLSGSSYPKKAVLVDEHTASHCLPVLTDELSPYLLIEIPSGEINKNLDTCQHIWDALTKSGFHRQDLLINLGGGVICDMGGFCAATYKRGIDFVNIPTTLLSQVDASVGGKLGVDFNGYKNQVGVFGEAHQVIVDTSFLATLPERQLLSGYAEVLKHCLIRDRESWNAIKVADPLTLQWDDIVSNSIKVKSEVVSEDFREGGIRKILNFGHSIGHGLESHHLGKSSELLHGEAIAAGMIMESWISTQVLDLPELELREITSTIARVFGKAEITEDDGREILEKMRMDKKNRDARMLFALISSIGSAVYDMEVTEELVLGSFEYYRSI